MAQFVSSESMSTLKELVSDYKDSMTQDFLKFLRFKSISTDPAYKNEVLACHDWVKEQLIALGLSVESLDTGGYPALFAKKEIDPQLPTILIYHHYDVQPVDPIQEWTHDPFEPFINEKEEVFARGAQDNKGQCISTLYALKLLLDKNQDFPVNIKVLIEGEEECGSPGLHKILDKNKSKLQADTLLVIDVTLMEINTPALTLGARGMLSFTVEFKGSSTDLHSGCHGGLAYNPNRALAEVVSSLRTPEGKVNIEGFYESIQELSEEEKSALDFSFDEEDYLQQFGTKAVGGEASFSPSESNWLRPTLEVNGVSGGWAGPGFKSVIPAKAVAKLSCRLVAGQDPKDVAKKVTQAIESRCPKGVEVNVITHPGMGVAAVSSPKSLYVQAMAKAYSEEFDKECRFIMNGASIPVTADLQQASGGDVIMMGYGLPGDNIHAPNEHFGIDRLMRSACATARGLELMAEIK